VMSNELTTPKLLICPADPTKQVATSFIELQPENISYQLRTGTNVTDTNPQEILLYCPIHKNTGYADGSVKQGKARN